MSKSPIELCLESMDSVDDDQPFVRCVATVEGEPGLGISANGALVWREPDVASALFWVSAHDQLILVRMHQAQPVRLIRGERFLDLRLEKPVVLMTEDLVVVADHAFRIHVGGVAQAVEPPKRLPLRRMNSTLVGAAIAAVSMAG